MYEKNVVQGLKQSFADEIQELKTHEDVHKRQQRAKSC